MIENMNKYNDPTFIFDEECAHKYPNEQTVQRYNEVYGSWVWVKNKFWNGTSFEDAMLFRKQIKE